MVRWVFRPYTQVRRQRFARQFRTTQASIKFSPDFTMSEHSSPSFGSQQKCSLAQLIIWYIPRDISSICHSPKMRTYMLSWPVMQNVSEKYLQVNNSPNKRLTLLLYKYNNYCCFRFAVYFLYIENCV